MNEYIRWLYQRFRVKIWAIPGRMIALIFIVLLLLIPGVEAGSYVLQVLCLAGIFAIYAASWDVLGGFTGQLNLGQALFFGVSAYTAALINLNFGLPPWVTIPIGSIAAVAVGLVAGIPALRVRGFYLALVTLSFPVILTGIILAFPDFSGGERGLFGVSSLSNSRIVDYYIIYVVMICSLIVMYKLTDAGSTNIRIGIVLHAIREDEITARTSGINTTRYKLLAFALSGFFAGTAGGLYVHYLGVIGLSVLGIFFSFQPILWTIFGGMRTIYGPVAGVFILFPVIEFLRSNPVGDKIRFVIFALMLIFTLLFMPEGLTPWIRDRIEVRCQRCKLINSKIRYYCRACRAPLHLERK